MPRKFKRTIVLKLTPSQQAAYEITRLNGDESVISIGSLGGEPTPEMLAENRRRKTEYNRRFQAILKKYGVRKEYLRPHLAKRRRLLAELREVRAIIATFKER